MHVCIHTHALTHIHMCVYIFIDIFIYICIGLLSEWNKTVSVPESDYLTPASSCRKIRHINFQSIWTSLAGANLNPFYIFGLIKNLFSLFRTTKKSLQEAICIPGGIVSSLGTIFTYFPAKLDSFVPESNSTLGGLSCVEVASSSAQIPGKTYLLIPAANV